MNSELHPIWLLIVSGVAAALPLLVGAMTCYAKVSVVLGFVRSGLGTQQIPNGAILMVLGLAISIVIMNPTIERTVEAASKLDPHQLSALPQRETLAKVKGVVQPWYEFMNQHAGARERETLVRLRASAGEVVDPQSFAVVLPAFVISELKQGFLMGFIVLVPFLVIDLIVAHLLVGLGMNMMSPPLISLPLKILFLFLGDGWLMIAKGLVESYGG